MRVHTEFAHDQRPMARAAAKIESKDRFASKTFETGEGGDSNDMHQRVAVERMADALSLCAAAHCPAQCCACAVPVVHHHQPANQEERERAAPTCC